MEITVLFAIIICLVASLFAGIGTGFVGMSAAVAITPILMGFLDLSHYEATAISLASDVLASAGAAFMYHRHGNVDVKNGFLLLCTVLVFTFLGSLVAYFMPNIAMGIGTLVAITLMGLKMLIFQKPRERKSKEGLTRRRKVIFSVIFGALIGFVCGFVGAGGGMLLLLVLTVFLGFEMHKAVGTSVFVMSFSAFAGAAFHVLIEWMFSGVSTVNSLTFSPYFFNYMILCVIFTVIFSIVGSRIANHINERKLNVISGIMLLVIAAVVAFIQYIYPLIVK